MPQLSIAVFILLLRACLLAGLWKIRDHAGARRRIASFLRQSGHKRPCPAPHGRGISPTVRFCHKQSVPGRDRQQRRDAGIRRILTGPARGSRYLRPKARHWGRLRYSGHIWKGQCSVPHSRPVPEQDSGIQDYCTSGNEGDSLSGKLLS